MPPNLEHFRDGYLLWKVSVLMSVKDLISLKLLPDFKIWLLLSLSTYYALDPINNILNPIAYGSPKLKTLTCEHLFCPEEEILLVLQSKKQALAEYYHYGRLSERVFKAINECTNLKTHIVIPGFKVHLMKESALQS
jgi:hypothetical protein